MLVVHASGQIVSGDGDGGLFGSSGMLADRPFAEWMREARDRSDVAAVVLRVDSPGGSGLASDMMWREIQLTREAGKPVVVSQAGLAASGGYYISAPADYIFAMPSTITGSIGVILRGNNLEKLLERVGIRFETVKSGLYKDILSPDKPLSDGERSILQALIDSSYSQFVAAVATGRKLSEETVRSFADGRVFSGAQALELGMVDLLGDEDTARREAARLAGLDEEKSQPVELGKERAGLVQKLRQELQLQLAWGGQPLWLFRP